jgi:two-component system response regulator FixJ
MKIDSYVVHVVDDEEAVRRSLAFLLTTVGFTVRVHASATDFLETAGSLGKACLVTDLRMPDMSGVELLETLRERGLTIPAIVITGQGDVPMAVAAMKAGAVDFIEKPFVDKTLADTGALQERYRLLSERECQVMAAVVAGHPNKTVAYDLGISPRTVEVHRANIMAKMQARSLPELVRMAIAMNLIEG